VLPYFHHIDRDKGLQTVSEYYSLGIHSTSLTQFKSCALHIGKNIGLSNVRGKTLITMLAKSPTEERYSHVLNMIDDEFSASIANKANDLRSTFCTDVDNVITNFGEVTNNGAEQLNATYKEFRKMPPLDALIHFLMVQREMFAKRYTEAISFETQQITVAPGIIARMRESFLDMTRKKWKCFVQNLQYNEKKTKIQSVEFSVQNDSWGNGGAAIAENFIVSLSPRATDFKNRIDCRCKYTQMLGYPCHHATVVLCSMQTDRKLGKNFMYDNIWKDISPAWYHEMYYITNYRQQYEISMQDKFMYVPNRNTLESRCLFPPEFKNRKGRRKSTRFRKKLKTNSSNQQSQTEDEDSSYTESEAGDAAAQAKNEKWLEFTTDVYQSLSKKIVSRCSYCGDEGHNKSTCHKKDVLYMLRNKSLLGPLLDCRSPMHRCSARCPKELYVETTIQFVLDNVRSKQQKKKVDFHTSNPEILSTQIQHDLFDDTTNVTFLKQILKRSYVEPYDPLDDMHYLKDKINRDAILNLQLPELLSDLEA
jgi:hypothetical protein